MSSHSFPTHKQKLTQSQEGGRRKERQRMKAFTKACIFSLSLSLFLSLSLSLSLSFYFLVFFLHTDYFLKNFFTHNRAVFFSAKTRRPPVKHESKQERQFTCSSVIRKLPCGGRPSSLTPLIG